eukprot:Nk52_evm2s272 gene=Nk52_evmTU2s272
MKNQSEVRAHCVAHHFFRSLDNLRIGLEEYNSERCEREYLNVNVKDLRLVLDGVSQFPSTLKAVLHIVEGIIISLASHSTHAFERETKCRSPNVQSAMHVDDQPPKISEEKQQRKRMRGGHGSSLSESVLGLVDMSTGDRECLPVIGNFLLEQFDAWFSYTEIPEMGTSCCADFTQGVRFCVELKFWFARVAQRCCSMLGKAVNRLLRKRGVNVDVMISSSDEELVANYEHILGNVLAEILDHPLFNFVSDLFIKCVSQEMLDLRIGNSFVKRGLEGKIACVFFNGSYSSKISGEHSLEEGWECCPMTEGDSSMRMEYYSDWIFVSVGRAFPEATFNLLTLFSLETLRLVPQTFPKNSSYEKTTNNNVNLKNQVAFYYIQTVYRVVGVLSEKYGLAEVLENFFAALTCSYWHLLNQYVKEFFENSSGDTKKLQTVFETVNIHQPQNHQEHKESNQNRKKIVQWIDVVHGRFLLYFFLTSAQLCSGNGVVGTIFLKTVGNMSDFQESALDAPGFVCFLWGVYFCEVISGFSHFVSKQNSKELSSKRNVCSLLDSKLESELKENVISFLRANLNTLYNRSLEVASICDTFEKLDSWRMTLTYLYVVQHSKKNETHLSCSEKRKLLFNSKGFEAFQNALCQLEKLKLGKELYWGDAKNLFSKLREEQIGRAQNYVFYENPHCTGTLLNWNSGKASPTEQGRMFLESLSCEIPSLCVLCIVADFGLKDSILEGSIAGLLVNVLEDNLLLAPGLVLNELKTKEVVFPGHMGYYYRCLSLIGQHSSEHVAAEVLEFLFKSLPFTGSVGSKLLHSHQTPFGIFYALKSAFDLRHETCLETAVNLVSENLKTYGYSELKCVLENFKLLIKLNSNRNMFSCSLKNICEMLFLHWKPFFSLLSGSNYDCNKTVLELLCLVTEHCKCFERYFENRCEPASTDDQQDIVNSEVHENQANSPLTGSRLERPSVCSVEELVDVFQICNQAVRNYFLMLRMFRSYFNENMFYADSEYEAKSNGKGYIHDYDITVKFSVLLDLSRELVMHLCLNKELLNYVLGVILDFAIKTPAYIRGNTFEEQDPIVSKIGRSYNFDNEKRKAMLTKPGDREMYASLLEENRKFELSVDNLNRSQIFYSGSLKSKFYENSKLGGSDNRKATLDVLFGNTEGKPTRESIPQSGMKPCDLTSKNTPNRKKTNGYSNIDSTGREKSLSAKESNLNRSLYPGMKLQETRQRYLRGKALSTGNITELISRCIFQHGMFSDTGLEGMKTLVDMVNIRLRARQQVPSIQQYKELLPKRSHFSRDLFVKKCFSANRIYWRLLSLLTEAPQIFCECTDIVDALLADLIGFWYATGATKSTDHYDHLERTCLLMDILRKGQWVPSPLCNSVDIFHLICPREISDILLSVWKFIHIYPPRESEFRPRKYRKNVNLALHPLQEGKPLQKQPFSPENVKKDCIDMDSLHTDSTVYMQREFIEDCVEPFTGTLKVILRNNIITLGANYARFFPPAPED